MSALNVRIVLASLALPLALGCGSSRSPAIPPASQPGATLAGPEMMDPVVTVAPEREIRAMSAEAERDEQRSGDERAAAQTALRRADGLLDIRKSELETTKRALELARREQREGERVDLEARRGALELRITMMEERRELYEDQVRLAEAERDAARARTRAAEQELQYARELEAWSITASRDSALNADIPPDDLLAEARRVLDSRRDVAERERVVAERRREMFDRQKRLLDAQARVGALQQR